MATNIGRGSSAPASLAAWRARPDHERQAIADHVARVIHARDRTDSFAAARARSCLLNNSAVPADILSDRDIDAAPPAVRRLLRRRGGR